MAVLIKSIRKFCSGLLCAICAVVITTVMASQFTAVVAQSDYMAPEDFLHQSFGSVVPESNTIWVSGELREKATAILGHKPASLRVRYWGDEVRSAWIIDEIGKTEPITFGVTVNQGKIENIKVLAFRESRGWEIKHSFFSKQFLGAGLTVGQKLNRNIDGISGATLSVKAMTNVSRLVLYLSGAL